MHCCKQRLEENMGLSSSLRRAVGYFDGSAPDVYNDDTVALPLEFVPHPEEPPDVRRLPHRGAAEFDEIYAEEEPIHRRRLGERAASPLALVCPPKVEFTLVSPVEFNDAQEIADRFRHQAAVICNLQGCEATLARRLVDFCSGLVYALDGSLQSLDDGLLLLAPSNVDLSSEAAAGYLAKGFFNQV